MPEGAVDRTLTIEGVNAMDHDTFGAVLGAVFERSPWVARRAWARRPFRDVAGLQGALEVAMREAPPEQQVALIRAHPELAGGEAVAGELTEASTREQSGAGLDRLSAEEVAALAGLNRAYRERFGFPLVVCVREHTVPSIVSWGRERLARSRGEEVETALGEIAKIARLRLEALVGERAE